MPTSVRQALAPAAGPAVIAHFNPNRTYILFQNGNAAGGQQVGVWPVGQPGSIQLLPGQVEAGRLEVSRAKGMEPELAYQAQQFGGAGQSVVWVWEVVITKKTKPALVELTEKPLETSPTFGLLKKLRGK